MFKRLFAIAMLVVLASCGGSTSNAAPPLIDADLDGLWDVQDNLPNDTDNDGLTNDVDPDDDNDGVADDADQFPFDPSEWLDTDGDGVGNTVDLDDDNDGVLDRVDAFPLDATESLESDGDGIGDNADPDDDNDGYPDVIDLLPFDATIAGDLDGDGLDSMVDDDDDGDGYTDTLELAEGSDPFDASVIPADADGDGLTDAQEIVWGSNPSLADTDADGVNDAIEFAQHTNPHATDSDADGLSDADEIGTDPTQVRDFDGDGIIDALDPYRSWSYRALEENPTSHADRFGCARNAKGDYCIAEPLAHQVGLYTATGQIFQTLSGLAAPNDCAWLPDGHVLIADSANDRLVVMSTAGAIIDIIAHQPDGSAGGFIQPRGLAVDATGNWYVADTWNNRIQQFDAMTAQWQIMAPTLTLHDPQDIAVNSLQHIAIADTGNARVVVVNAAGDTIQEYSAASLHLGPQLLQPRSVAFGSDDALYILDAAQSRVIVVAADGTVRATYGQAGQAANELFFPSAIVVDQNGRVSVTDRNRVQEW